MKTSSTDSQESIKSELEFRLWFRDEFAIDYIDAIQTLSERKKESERLWRQLLVKHGVIK